MKGLGNMIAMLGILVFVYSIVGRYVGGATIGLGIVKTTATAGLVLGSGIMLIGIVINQLGKK